MFSKSHNKLKPLFSVPNRQFYQVHDPRKTNSQLLRYWLLLSCSLVGTTMLVAQTQPKSVIKRRPTYANLAPIKWDHTPLDVMRQVSVKLAAGYYHAL